MWQSRKKDVEHDEDAELRALAKAYAQLHEEKNPSRTPAPLASGNRSRQVSSPDSSMEPLPELPMDEVIRGSSLSYTRAEAKLYANEEPCDTWRHFDVPSPLQRVNVTIRNGSVIIYRSIWDQIIIVTAFGGRQLHTGTNFVSALIRKA